MRYKNITAVIIFAASICFFNVTCSPAAEVRNDGYLRQYDFANTLFEDGDYFRAITEYKRFIFYHPDDKDLCRNASFKICLSYVRAKQWKSVVEACESFINTYGDSEMTGDVLFYKAKAEKELKIFEDALNSLEMIIENHPDGELKNKAYYESGLILVEMEDWDKAGSYFGSIPNKSHLYDSAFIFSEGLKKIDGIPKKSPAVAGTLAAVVPGSGHLYTNRPRDALVAFLLNGAFIWAAVELFEDDNYVAGSVVTFFELGWYSGNIYSAVSSAHKYNKRSKEMFLDGLKKKTGLGFFHDPSNRTDYIFASMTF